jgi:secreted trypsin-like serine protease
MMFTSTKQWILVGLTSFGDGCAKPTSSGVYTRVAAYENWIKSNTDDSYSSVPFSYANTMQTSIRSMVLLVALFVIIF